MLSNDFNLAAPRLRQYPAALLCSVLASLVSAVSAQGLDVPDRQQQNATPQEIRRVWDEFVIAIRQGNLEGALSYIQPYSPVTPQWRAQGVQQLQKMLADVVSVDDCVYTFSAFAKCTVVRRLSPESHLSSEVPFVRSGGRWYLAF